MQTKHFLFVLLSALCLVTAWAQPFDADIRQTADYKQASSYIPVLLGDNAPSYRTNLGLGWPTLASTDPATWRTNLGLLWSGLTNTTREAIGSAITFTSQEWGTNQSTFYVPIAFGGNVSGNAATSRSNLGLGWSALTNTNADNFEAALFPATNNAPTNTASVAGWVDLRVGTNTFKLPLYR